MKAVREHKVITVCVIAAVLIAALVLVRASRTTEEDRREQIESITDTIYERALQCYVIEGAYPESLEYLEENYGLAVNKESYYIVYTPFAENLPPDVRVIERAKGDQNGR